jgi:hypothetical protein
MPSFKTLMGFYMPLLKREFGMAMKRGADRSSRIILWIGAILAFLLLINKTAGQAVDKSWQGVSPSLALIPLGLDLVYGLLAANYMRFREITEERNGLEKDMTALMSASRGYLSVIRSAVARECGYVRLSAQDRLCLMQWTHEALAQPPKKYPITEMGNGWNITYGNVNCTIFTNSEQECQAIQEMHEKVVASLRASALPADMLK